MELRVLDERLSRTRADVHEWFIEKLLALLPAETAETVGALAAALTLAHTGWRSKAQSSGQSPAEMALAALRTLPTMQPWEPARYQPTIEAVLELLKIATAQKVLSRFMAIHGTEFAALTSADNPLFTPAWQVAVQRLGEIHHELKNMELGPTELGVLFEEGSGILRFMNNNQALSEEMVKSWDEALAKTNATLDELKAQGWTNDQIKAKIQKEGYDWLLPNSQGTPKNDNTPDQNQS